MARIIMLKSADISCPHCAMAIKRGLAQVEGVSQVEVDVATKAVTLSVVDDQALLRAKATLDEIGYPAVELA